MNVRDVMKSFQIQDTLNTNVWEEDKSLNPKVRKILLKVAKKFISDWNIDKKIKIHDIRFTGSLAAYNWSKFSDIDLHIIVNYGDLNDDLNLAIELIKKILLLLLVELLQTKILDKNLLI